MIVLADTSDIVEVVTSAATAVQVLVTFADNTTTTYTPGVQRTGIASATTTTVASSPAASTQRHIKAMSVFPTGGAQTVTIKFDDGAGNEATLISVALGAGESAHYEDGQGWYVLTSDGSLKTSALVNGHVIRVDGTAQTQRNAANFVSTATALGVSFTGTDDAANNETEIRGTVVAASDTLAGGIEIAIQSEQETGTDVVRAVTPGRQHFHLSACKCFGFTTGAGTPVLHANSYNTTSITDTAAGRLTVTIGNDFSSANWCATLGVTIATTAARIVGAVSKAAGSVILEADDAADVAADPGVGWDWAFFGDL